MRLDDYVGGGVIIAIIAIVIVAITVDTLTCIVLRFSNVPQTKARMCCTFSSIDNPAIIPNQALQRVIQSFYLLRFSRRAS